jgi:NAD(P)-dependent dehydrogenase (short-subunit alcohol dehydrogenase family)
LANKLIENIQFISSRSTNNLRAPSPSRRSAMSTTTSSQAPVTLVTGGSRGLGRNAALHLARQGSDLILTYRSSVAEAEAVAAEIRALGRRAAILALDVADSASFPAFAAQVRQVLAGWGRERFDHLFNNAGTGIHAAFADTSEAQFDELVKIHLKGPFFLTQALLPLIADGGRILNVSSGLARFALPGYAAYATMKGGVEVLTRYLAKELGARGISVNTLAPGAIETDFGGGAVRDNAQLNTFVASQTALGRVGLPDDIGAVVAALLAPGTGWINAQRIEASGGMML